ncbi:MAG TPA: flagellar FlbD family protein [Acidimicrobiales bacterium]|nr:flagellar FlbD family protein [Acidimicrobiales bacterium]
MISLTRLNGERIALNPELIERAEETPDTVLTLVNGTKYVVQESLDELIERVRVHRASILALSQHLQVDPSADTPGTPFDAGQPAEPTEPGARLHLVPVDPHPSHPGEAGR